MSTRAFVLYILDVLDNYENLSYCRVASHIQVFNINQCLVL